MRVMIDTNVILDVLLKRTDFFESSYAILKMVSVGQIDGFLSANVVTDVYYVLHQTNKDKAVSLDAVREMLRLIKIVDVKNIDIISALDTELEDYGYAVQSAVAQNNKINWIITRDENNFTNSPVPAISPQDFIKEYGNMNT